MSGLPGVQHLMLQALTKIGVSAADANILINTCRLAAQRYTFAYQEPIPVEQLVRTLCDNKQVSVLLPFSSRKPALLASVVLALNATSILNVLALCCLTEA